MLKLADWYEVKKMNDKELKKEWKLLSEKISELSSYSGLINDNEELEKFGIDFGECLQSLHDLRLRTEGLFFDKQKE